MTVQPRIGCFVYNDSTFWSMLAHGVSTRAAEFGAAVDVQSARDVDGQDTILARMIGQEAGQIVLQRGLAFPPAKLDMEGLQEVRQRRERCTGSPW